MQNILYIFIVVSVPMLGCEASFGPASRQPELEPGLQCADLIAGVVSVEDFEGGATGWSNNTTDSSEPDSFSQFLGRFAGALDEPTEVVSKEFPLSGAQDGVVLEFDFYQIDSWDKEEFLVTVDGKVHERRGFRFGRDATENQFTAFLGPMSGRDKPSKEYPLDGTQTQVTLEFDFYQIDSWDDGEVFDVYIDDALVVSHNFAAGADIPSSGETLSGITYTASTKQTGELGFANRNDAWLDGIHHYEITFDNSATSFRLRFETNLDGMRHNESWGVDNIVVTSNASGQSAVSSEDFEAGPGEGWSVPTWYSGPQVTTKSTGDLGFRTGSNIWNDGIHHYRMAIPAKGNSVTIGFGDILDELAPNETFGIDNFVLTEICTP